MGGATQEYNVMSPNTMHCKKKNDKAVLPQRVTDRDVNQTACALGRIPERRTHQAK